MLGALFLCEEINKKNKKVIDKHLQRSENIVVQRDKGERTMEFIYSDGGRSKYFKAQDVGDCGVRSICNATGKDYKEVYNAINELAKHERRGKRKKSISNARNGVYVETLAKYLSSIGWAWHATMEIGSGCQTHLDEDELPEGTLIVRVSRHFTCVKDGVIYDTFDPSRGGTRCVYGYWSKD